MNTLQNLFSDLTNHFQKETLPILERLQIGLAFNDIIQMLASQGLENENLVKLYHWRNGISASEMSKKNIEELELFPNGIMLSLEDAITHYNLYTKEQAIWGRCFFPIFTDGGGDYLLLDIGNNIHSAGAVFLYSPSLLLSEEPALIYDSINSLFQTILDCYMMGAYDYNTLTNTIEIDYEKRQKISSTNNPQSTYWS